MAQTTPMMAVVVAPRRTQVVQGGAVTDGPELPAGERSEQRQPATVGPGRAGPLEGGRDGGVEGVEAVRPFGRRLVAQRRQPADGGVVPALGSERDEFVEAGGDGVCLVRPVGR